jgi:hypothetical protein
MWRQLVVLIACVAGCSSSNPKMEPEPDAGEEQPRPSLSFAVTPLKLLGNGKATATLKVRLSPGASQEISIVSSGQSTIVPSSGMTDETGTFTATLTSTQVGTQTLTARAGELMQTATLVVTEPCPVPLLPGPPMAKVYAPIVADFNGDGAPDVVGVVENGIGFMSGNGDGSFQFVERALTAMDNLRGFAAADFDGDGVLDLMGVASGTQSGYVLFYKGSGTGTFAAGVPNPVGGYPAHIVTGDFDGDKHVDVAVMGANNTPPSIHLLYSNGNGMFQPALAIPTTLSINNEIVLLAVDLNGDGSDDLVSSTYYSPNVTVSISGGANRSFSAAYDVPIALAGVGALAAGDFNEDGKQDVLVHGYYPGGLLMLVGNGTGAFPATRTFTGAGMGVALGVRDINGDMNLDVVVTDGRHAIVHHGDGTGNLAALPQIETPPHGALAFADMDRDGDADLVLDGAVGKYTAGQFRFPLPVTEAVQSSAAGDFDGDGKLDLATVPILPDQNGKVAVRRGNGDGTFQTPDTYVTGNTPRIVLAAHLNSDTKLDLAVSTDQNVTLLLNNGSGQFTTSSTLALQPMNRHWALVVRDFNGDSKQDLAVTSEPWGGAAALDVALGNGDGTFGTTSTYAISPWARQLAAGSLRGNGVVDIVVGPPLRISLGVGDGSFAAPVASGIDTGSLWDGGVALADMNGDGKLDVLASSTSLGVRYGNGDGTFGAATGLAHSSFGNPHLAVDVDNDGLLDIVGGDGQLSVVTNNGDGTFSPVLVYPTYPGLSAQRSVVGDWNGDGLLDISTTGGLVLQQQCTP